MERFAPVFVILAAMLWGTDGIVLRPSLYNLPVPLVVMIESSIVAIILTPFFKSHFKELRRLSLKDWLAFAGVAIFGGAIGTMAITRALFYVNYVNLSIVMLIQKLQPAFAIMLAAILLRERLTRWFAFWATLAILGAYLMTFGLHLPDWHSGDKTLDAVLFALVASVSFGLSTVLSKRALKNVSFELGTYIRFLISAVFMMLLVFSLGEFNAIHQISKKQLFIFLIIAFSTGGPAIFLYYYGLKHISASVATICELAFPLTAVVLEYLVHGNLLSFIQWVGVVILLVSMIQVSRMKIPSKNGDNSDW